jgi:hypothetical protein
MTQTDMRPPPLPASATPGDPHADDSLDAVFDAVPHGLCILSADLVVRRINRAMVRWLPPDAGEPIGRPCRELFARGGCPCASARPGRPWTAGRPRRGRWSFPCPMAARPAWNFRPSVCRVRTPDRRASCFSPGTSAAARPPERELRRANQDIELLLSSIGSILVSLDGEDTVNQMEPGRREDDRPHGRPGRRRSGFSIWISGGTGAGPGRHRRMPPVLAARAPGRGQAAHVRGRALCGAYGQSRAGARGAGPGRAHLGRDLTQIKVREAMATHETKMQSIGRLAAGIATRSTPPSST